MMEQIIEENRVENIEIIDVDNFDYDDYQVVRGEFFAHITEPCFIFNNNKIYVNTACVRRLPETEFVQILVNPEEKKLVVKPCEESEKDSFKWRANSEKIRPKQVSCRIFFAKIYWLTKIFRGMPNKIGGDYRGKLYVQPSFCVQ